MKKLTLQIGLTTMVDDEVAEELVRAWGISDTTVTIPIQEVALTANGSEVSTKFDFCQPVSLTIE